MEDSTAENVRADGSEANLEAAALESCRVALKKEQDKAIQLKNKNWQLSLENGWLRTHINSLSIIDSAFELSWLTHPALLNYQSEIAENAQKFAVLYQLWPVDDAFMKERPIPQPTLRGITFPSEEVKSAIYACCATNEIYECMPLEFWDFILELPAFQHSVLDEVKKFRSDMIAQAKDIAPNIFASLNLSSQCWNPGCRQQPSELFLNLALKKIGRFLLFGPDSLNDGFPLLAENCTSMTKWAPLAITTGLVSASATITFIKASFLLSCDREFLAKGDYTAIPYAYRFHEYKKLLEHEGDKMWVQHLFADWNLFIFSDVPEDVLYVQEAQIDDDIEARVLAVLTAMSEGDYLLPKSQDVPMDVDTNRMVHELGNLAINQSAGQSSQNTEGQGRGRGRGRGTTRSSKNNARNSQKNEQPIEISLPMTRARSKMA
ncbi:hypothetical protein H0H93_010133 [Arthromyces matolae]|nr:hypothetical protein H0H93_010133 [Arthromyces matolae]